MANFTPTDSAVAVPDAIRALKCLFRGRLDDFVIRTGNLNGTPRTKRAGRPLRDSDYEAHLRGTCSIGPYNLSPDLDGGRGCRFGCVDIDRGDGPALEAAKKAVGMIQFLGLSPTVEISRRGRWHAWVFFQETVRSATVRRVLCHIADSILIEFNLFKLDDDTGEFKLDKLGRRQRAVEVFPKHDELGRMKWGDALQLPLNGALLQGGRTALVDSTWQPFADQYAALLEIEPDPADVLAGAVALVPDPPKPREPKKKPRQQNHASSDPWIDVKAALDLVEYVEKSMEVKGRRAGAEVAFLCPFHDETEPSFMVNAEKRLFHCHGCGMAGDVFDFHEKFHGIDKRTALKQLAELAGVEIGEKNGETRSGRRNHQSRKAVGGGNDGGSTAGVGSGRIRESQSNGVGSAGTGGAFDSRNYAGDATGHGGTDKGTAEKVSTGGGILSGPRGPTDELLLEYMLGRDGPRYTFREGSTAYSKRDEMSYNVTLFRNLCGTRPVLNLIIDRSSEMTAADFDKKESGLYGVARRILHGWVGPVFGEILRRLPEGGEVGGTTATERASLADRMKLVLTKVLTITTDAYQYTQHASLLSYASDTEPAQWHKVGGHMAWCKAGPRIAMRGDFFMSHSGMKTMRVSAEAIAQRLRKAGVIAQDRIDKYTRMWRVRDDWLAETFDLDVEEEIEVPKPAEHDVKKLAAGDTEDKDDIPF